MKLARKRKSRNLWRSLDLPGPKFLQYASEAFGLIAKIAFFAGLVLTLSYFIDERISLPINSAATAIALPIIALLVLLISSFTLLTLSFCSIWVWYLLDGFLIFRTNSLSRCIDLLFPKSLFGKIAFVVYYVILSFSLISAYVLVSVERQDLREYLIYLFIISFLIYPVIEACSQYSRVKLFGGPISLFIIIFLTIFCPIMFFLNIDKLMTSSALKLLGLRSGSQDTIFLTAEGYHRANRIVDDKAVLAGHEVEPGCLQEEDTLPCWKLSGSEMKTTVVWTGIGPTTVISAAYPSKSWPDITSNERRVVFDLPSDTVTIQRY